MAFRSYDVSLADAKALSRSSRVPPPRHRYPHRGGEMRLATAPATPCTVALPSDPRFLSLVVQLPTVFPVSQGSSSACTASTSPTSSIDWMASRQYDFSLTDA